MKHYSPDQMVTEDDWYVSYSEYLPVPARGW